jgi:ubiquinone/menaquinone biosynthesis C-methylase UbiE
MSRSFFDKIAPDWDSWETSETLAAMQQMVERFDFPSGSKILDLGCGTGNIINFMQEKAPDCHFTGLDYSFNMLHRARQKNSLENSDLLCADARKLPFPDKSFECLICFSCFPHFREQQQVLQEFHRVLKKNGILYIAHIVSSVEINKLHRKLDAPVKSDILPTGEEMRKLLQNAAFSQIQIYDQEYFLTIAQK